ncbi:MAG: lipoprotein [Candidatus Protistobacter heckmanni]|nr:lipoprotein [Candidatus Protistobacter heckmanni]
MIAAAATLCLTGSLAGCGVRGPLYYPVIPPLPAAPASQPPEDMPKTSLDGGKLDVTPHPQAKPAASAIAPAAGSESATSPEK